MSSLTESSDPERIPEHPQRGRKKKELDIEALRILRQKGLPVRKIAEQYNQTHVVKISYVTISRIMKQNYETEQRIMKQKSNSTSKVNYETKTGNYETKPKSSDVPIPTDMKLAESGRKENIGGTKAFYSSHHIAFAIHFRGIISDGYQYKTGNNNSVRGVRINTLRSRIDAKNQTIVIWPDRIEAETVAEHKKFALEIVKEELASLARNNHLDLDWKSLKQVSKAHFVVEHDSINEEMLDSVTKEDKSKLQEQGITLGDRSHPHNIEFTGMKSEERARTFLWLLDEFPLQFVALTASLGEMVSVTKEYNESTQQRFELIENELLRINYRLESMTASTTGMPKRRET